jgi:hypothetical protein
VVSAQQQFPDCGQRATTPIAEVVVVQDWTLPANHSGRKSLVRAIKQRALAHSLP